jgi:hypothetical protein
VSHEGEAQSIPGGASGGVRWVLQWARLVMNGDMAARVEQARSDRKRTERNNEPSVFV